jgi:aromatic ring-opening dioxygenase catalytic subunit (LigB family)
MYPQADIPVLQISMPSLEPKALFEIGAALQPLRDEGVLVVGSGLSWHNLRMFGPAARAPSKAFDAWLDETLKAKGAERSGRLELWERAPAARLAHPQEDHFVPLMVAVGAAEDEPATRVYHEEDFMGGVTASSYRFGELGPRP